MDAHEPGVLDDAPDQKPDAGIARAEPEERISSDDASLDDLDKTLADSFPSSDPPSAP